MSERIPRIRRYSEGGQLALREGLILSFFMRRSHGEAAPSVARALDTYLRTVGPDKLGWYANTEGEWQPLDDKGWEHVRDRLLNTPHAQGCPLLLDESGEQAGGYRFQYHGRKIDAPFATRWPGMVSGVSFWLPTGYLEEQGPERVRGLAVALARELPITSGYVSLAFNHLGMTGTDRVLNELCFHYLGMDIHDLPGTCYGIGTGARGVYWLNFYGQPLLERLGGCEGLRARLALPEISVEELGEDKVLVALGEWPTVGEVTQPEALRPYRELARVLEPHLSEEVIRWHGFSLETMRRWQRRFLD